MITKSEVIMSFLSLAFDVASDILQELMKGGDVGNMKIRDLPSWRAWEKKNKPDLDYFNLDKEFDKRIPK